MKCVILAAGTSSRLHPLTLSTPKCLLPVGNKTILERSVESVQEQGISEFVIVTGFQSKMIVDFLDESFSSLHLEFIRNDKFAETNNAYSLALTGASIRSSDLLIMDSDIIFDKRILSDLLTSEHENCLVLRTRGGLHDEDVKVRVDEHGMVLNIGKDLNQNVSAGESLGMEKFSSKSAMSLFEVLERRVVQERKTAEYYETAFQELIESRVPIYAVDAKHHPCIEIDTLVDLEYARRHVVPKLDQV